MTLTRWIGLPLIKRELVALLRTRRAFWLLVLTVAASFGVCLLAWPWRGSADVAARTPGLFLAFSLTQVIGALLVTPALTAGAISRERERNTWDLLYGTHLPPMAIVVSKAVASMGLFVVLLVASLPATALLYLLGGLSLRAILLCHATTFLAVLAATLTCLAASARSERTTTAVLRAASRVFLWHFGLFFLLLFTVSLLSQGIVFRRGGSWLVDFGAIAVGTSVPMTQLELLAPGLLRGNDVDPVWVSIAWCTLIAAVHLAYLLVAVRRADLPVSKRRERRERRARRRAVRDGWASGQRPKGRPAWLTRLAIEWGRRGRFPCANPVFLREIGFELIGRRAYRAGFFWMPLAIGVCVGLAVNLRWDDLSVSLILTAHVIAGLLVVGSAASGIARESDQGQLDLLRGTSLTPGAIVRGKVLAAVYGGLGPVLAVLLILSVVFFIGYQGPGGYLRLAADSSRALTRVVKGLELFAFGAVGLVVHMFLLASLGTFASCVAKRVLMALAIAYGLVLALYLGAPLVWDAVVPDLVGRRIRPGASVGFFSPMWYAAKVLELLRHGTGPWWTRDLTGYSVVTALHIAAIVALQFASRWALARRLGRRR